MRMRIGATVCGWVVVATLGAGAGWAQDGHGCILGWGHQVIAGDFGAGFEAIAAGGFHSLGIEVHRAVVAWGDNSYGQCNLPSANADFVAVAGGRHHNLALKGDGAIVAWGRNDYGQCNVPTANTGFVAVAGGYDHSLGLKGHPRGDLNCDRRIDFGDINPFVLALIDPSGYATLFPNCDITNADINANGTVGFDDINPFVLLLTQP